LRHINSDSQAIRAVRLNSGSDLNYMVNLAGYIIPCRNLIKGFIHTIDIEILGIPKTPNIAKRDITIN
jgi:hypothetical protein